MAPHQDGMLAQNTAFEGMEEVFGELISVVEWEASVEEVVGAVE